MDIAAVIVGVRKGKHLFVGLVGLALMINRLVLINFYILGFLIGQIYYKN